MRLHRALYFCLLWLASALFQAAPVNAQFAKHGGTEISVMHGFVVASSSSHNREAVRVIMTPVPPVWRLTFWTHSALTIDLGFTLLAGATEGENASILNIETGAGFNFAGRESKTVPFAGVVGGLVNFSASHMDDESDPYIGIQVGSRTFFRDFAAVRFQGGLRHLFVSKGKEVNLFELVGGLSFFL